MQQRLLLAAGAGLLSRSCSGTAAPGCSRAGSAGSSAPPNGSRAVGSTSRSSTGPRRARPAGGRVRAHARRGWRSSTTPGASSSPTPRTSCARRSSRLAASWSCSTTRSSTRPRRREFLASMREQVVRLTKLASDLLDLSRLDAGRLTVEREPVDLAALAEDVAEEFRPVARGTQHLLEVSPSERRCFADADEHGCSRSAGSSSRTRSCTRPRERRCALRAGFTDDRAALRGAGRRRRAFPTTSATSCLRALLPARRDARLRQRARSRDREGARGADGRHDRAGHRSGADGVHV